jgi:hypothetical protein
VDSVFVEVEHEGVTGYGEASPQEHYGESAASASTFLSAAESLLGDDPFALDEIEERTSSLPGEHAAKAAVDMALHDLCGKLGGVRSGGFSVCGRHGARRRRGRSGSAIPDDMAQPDRSVPATASSG